MPDFDSEGLVALISSRRSIRQFRPDIIPEQTITQLLLAAHWAPSAHNRQPWRFVVITDPQWREALASQMAMQLRADLRTDGLPEDQIEADATRSYTRLISAPVLIVVGLSMADMHHYPDRTRQSREYIMAVQSVAMAGQNLLLMAHALGLGAVWLCAPLFCPETVRTVLGTPGDFEAQGVIALGYPDEKRTKGRDPLDPKVLWR